MSVVSGLQKKFGLFVLFLRIIDWNPLRNSREIVMKFKFLRLLSCNLPQILLHDLGAIRMQFRSFEFGKGEKE